MLASTLGDASYKLYSGFLHNLMTVGYSSYFALLLFRRPRCFTVKKMKQADVIQTQI